MMIEQQAMAKDRPEVADSSADSAEIVEITQIPPPSAVQADQPPGRTAQQTRHLLAGLSTIPLVLLPTLLGAFYYLFVAADRFAVETKFSVRMVTGSTSNDIIGSVTGISGPGSTITDSYILIDFIKSREIIDKLSERIDLRSIYSHENADFLTAFDRTGSVEDLKNHLDSMIEPYYDPSSQVITMEVQAFTPEDARTVSREILRFSEQLVNELSEKARADSLQHARAEVARNENRLRQVRSQIRSFRDIGQEIDPSKTAESQFSILSGIEQRLADHNAELTNLLRFMKEDAPSIVVLKSKIRSLESQAALERARMGVDVGQSDLDANRETLSARIENFEILELEQEFSQKAYLSSLSSLENARLEADRQQRYLAVFVRPSTPEEALYPNRHLNILIVFITSVLIWGITVMLVYVVREHII